MHHSISPSIFLSLLQFRSSSMQKPNSWGKVCIQTKKARKQAKNSLFSIAVLQIRTSYCAWMHCWHFWLSSIWYLAGLNFNIQKSNRKINIPAGVARYRHYLSADMKLLTLICWNNRLGMLLSTQTRFVCWLHTSDKSSFTGWASPPTFVY